MIVLGVWRFTPKNLVKYQGVKCDILDYYDEIFSEILRFFVRIQICFNILSFCVFMYIFRTENTKYAKCM